MSPPMKVALLGAPGSGKSKIARRIARRLNTDSKDWVVIDGYIEKLAEKTGRTFGDVYDRYAFPLNIMALSERWRLEDEVTRHMKNTITCGSIYETIIYGAAQSVPIANLPNEQWMVDETYISSVMMAAFSSLAFIRNDYDILLYLPLSEEPHSWDGVVNAKLDEVLSNCNREAMVLEGSDRKKVDDATTIIQEAHSQALAYDREQGLRASREVGEGTEHRPDEVPDLSEAEASSAPRSAESDPVA